MKLISEETHALNVSLINVFVGGKLLPLMWLVVFLFCLIVSFPTKSVVVQGRDIQSLNDTRIFVWRKFITPAMDRKFRKTPKPVSNANYFLW